MDILTNVVRGVIGIVSLLGIAYFFSSDRSKINWALVAKGMGIQIFLAALVIYVKPVEKAFEFVSSFFVAILAFSAEGAAFLFGDLVTNIPQFGYIFAFQILPTIIFFSAVSAILFYLGILQKIVGVFAKGMSKFMGLSGPESLAAAGNIFLGQTESPFLVKPYLEKMTRSEIMALMTGGMATIAGGVFAAYVGMLGAGDPEKSLLVAKHLLIASILSAPAAIVAAKILVPETTPEKVNQEMNIPKDKIGANILDAIANGTTDGLKLAVNVAAMLLVFLALKAMGNGILDLFCNFNAGGSISSINQMLESATDGQFTKVSLEVIFGVLFAPIAWLLGTPTQDLFMVGQLLGEKTVVNEFVAYTSLQGMMDGLQPKSFLIATYALCGFSNFSSIGIQIGGIGALAPGQRLTLSELGIKALIGGTIACFLTATVAGMMTVV